jgi:hypothetical protein
LDAASEQGSRIFFSIVSLCKNGGVRYEKQAHFFTYWYNYKVPVFSGREYLYQVTNYQEIFTNSERQFSDGDVHEFLLGHRTPPFLHNDTIESPHTN